MRRWIVIVSILLAVLIVALVVVCAVNADAIQKIFTGTSRKGNGKTATDIEKEMHKVTIGDGEYLPRDGITTLLIIGLDKFGKAVASDSYNNNQQADFVTLVVLDDNSKTYTVLHLNRDTMTNINVLGITGQVARTTYAQLALSHTYGNGLASSCINTADAVSGLLYGVNIDYYLSMTMDAAEILSDLVGGITLTVSQDMTIVNENWYEGATVTLSGEDALLYVRDRSDLPDSSNVSRMQRQKDFMYALIAQLIEKRQDPDTGDSYFLSMYDAVADYIVSNASATAFSDMADKLAEYTSNGIVSPEGEAVKGKEFIEFYVDEEKLQQLAIGLFFTPLD